MDITSLSPSKAASKPAFLHLRNPFTNELLYDTNEDGEPDLNKPAGIWLLGTDCPKYKAKAKELQKELLKNPNKDPAENGAAMIVSLMTGWQHLGFGSSEELFEFNEENATKLVLDPDSEWVVEQIRPFVTNRRNHYPNLKSA